MIRLPAHPIFIALLVAGLMGTPVTYRGGATEPHPHMFLQLWQDAASGSFTHQAHQADRHARHLHGHAMATEPAQQRVTSFDDPPDLTVSPFVVSDWGVSALHAPSSPLMAGEQSRRHREVDRTVIPSGIPAAPELPPPQ